MYKVQTTACKRRKGISTIAVALLLSAPLLSAQANPPIRTDLHNRHNWYGAPQYEDITLSLAFGEVDTGALVELDSSEYHPLLYGWFIVLGDQLYPFRTSSESFSRQNQSFSFTLSREAGSAQGSKHGGGKLVYGEAEKHLSPMSAQAQKDLTSKLRLKSATVHGFPPHFSQELFKSTEGDIHIYVSDLSTSTTVQMHSYMGEPGTMIEFPIEAWHYLTDGGTSYITIKDKGLLHVPQTRFPRPGGPLPPTWKAEGSSYPCQLTVMKASSDTLNTQATWHTGSSSNAN
jgi:hypothetical protein